MDDKRLAEELQKRLKTNPIYYLNFLKNIIDSIHERIDDKVFFELLKPVMVPANENELNQHVEEWDLRHQRITEEMEKALQENSETPEEEIRELFNKQHDELDMNMAVPMQIDDALIPSGDNVDLFYHPGIRKKMKEWIREYFDPRLPDYKQAKARDKLEKVFLSLIYKGQGSDKKLTPSIRRKIDSEYILVEKKIKNIIHSNKKAIDREEAIKKAFGKIGRAIEDGKKNESFSVKTIREAVNSYFAAKYNLSPKTVDNYLRDLREPFKYFNKDSSVDSVVIDGSGKNKTVVVSRSEGSS